MMTAAALILIVVAHPTDLGQTDTVPSQATTEVSTAGSITASSKVLTSTGAPFTSSDVGKNIIVAGAGASGEDLETTVQFYVSGGEVRLREAAQTTVSGSASIRVGGDLSSSSIATVKRAVFAFAHQLAPSQLTANQDDWSPTDYDDDTDLIRLSTDASRDLTGITGGSGGRILCLVNVGSNDLVLKDDDSGSLAANRFLLPGSSDLTVGEDDAVILEYDATDSRWRVASSTVGSGGGGGGGSGSSYAETFGDGATTSFTINHALSNSDPLVQVRRVSDNQLIEVEIETTDSNNCEIVFDAYTPALNEFRVVVMGEAANQHHQTFGNGADTSFAIIHGLSSQDLLVQVKRVSDQQLIEVEIENTDSSTTTITFEGHTPASNEFRVSILK